MYIDLQDHHLKRLIPVVEARLKVIKRKVMKDFGADWGDYDEQGLEIKINEKSDEYFRLKQVLREIKNA